MLSFNKSEDINRLLIILICEYIYENKAKVYLLSTCKFMHKSRKYILFYEQVDVSKITNNKIKKRLTYVHFKFELPTKKLFDNVSNIKINNYQNYLGVTITYLPPKLKKLEIPKNNVRFDSRICMPNTLETLCFKNYQSLPDNFFNDGLKKLIMDTCYTTNLILLPSSLKYLKLSGTPNIDYFPDLKCLILDIYCNIVKPLPDSIKHLGLYVQGNMLINLNKNIIPKNLTHFEFDDNKWCDILCEFPKLTKVTIKEKNNMQSIPPSITSISNGYYVDYRFCRKISFFSFLSNIEKTVTTLSLNTININICSMIPETISKLKIYNLNIDQDDKNNIWSNPKSFIPKNIKELHVENLISRNHKLFLSVGVQKLTIKYTDRHLLDPSVYVGRHVRYKY